MWEHATNVGCCQYLRKLLRGAAAFPACQQPGKAAPQTGFSTADYATTNLMALAMALLASIWLAAVVSAHGPEVLQKTEPADGVVLEQSPAQVTAWFSDELDTKLSTLQVFDSTGRQVDNGDGGVDLNDPDHATLIVSLPALPAGEYTARWTVTLDDGDSVKGEFTFRVGDKSAIAAKSSASQAPAPQAATSAQSSSGKSAGLPLGWIAAGLAVLVLIVGGLTLRLRRA